MFMWKRIKCGIQLSKGERRERPTNSFWYNQAKQSQQSQNDYLNLIVFYLCQPWHLFSQMDLPAKQQATAYLWV